VRESIAQQQCESEKLISWVQFFLVVTFEQMGEVTVRGRQAKTKIYTVKS
jgi:hypothetical protein